MANITYHRFDENGQYTQTVNAPEENLNFEDPTRIYVGEFDDGIHLYYHDFETNRPALKPENPNASEYKEFNYVTKQWINQEPYQITTEMAWNTVKVKRFSLLKSSDWTQLPDVPLATKETWATYRQALRDITQQADPFNITWPTAPQ